jgi:zinc protease
VRKRLYLIFATLALAILSCAKLTAAAAAQWPRADIAGDPAIKLGVLPNGMRYAIMKNNTPAGAVSIHLSVMVGASYEAPRERGFSHFVEHMAFRGSKNFPDGEINRTLERLGLRFGADTNASTGQYLTDYRFDLPAADAKSVSDGLAVARDVASNINFDAAAVETEAGVVLSEAAMRGNPAFRSGLAEMKFELADERAAALAGGQDDIVQHPVAPDLVRFYRTWYRPERAVLTVTGDIDPAQLESQIIARFSDWKGSGPAGREPSFRVPFDRGLESHAHVEPGVPQRLVLAWVKPPAVHPLDRAAWKRERIHVIALEIAARRLAAMAAQAEPPFLNALPGQRDALHAAQLYTLSAAFSDGNWNKALNALAQLRLTLLHTPVAQAEIDSVVMAEVALQRRQEGAADTRATPQLAGLLAGGAAADEIIQSPAQARVDVEEDLTGLTPEHIGQAWAEMFGPGDSSKGDPLIFVSSRQPVEEGAVTDGYRAVTSEAQPAEAAATVKWPYTDFGAPGRVVEITSAADLGITVQRFANNVRLLVRPSKTRLNQVLVSIKVGDGRAGLPKDNAIANWIFSSLVPGGVGALSTTEMISALSGRSYRALFTLSDGAFTFNGATTPHDLDIQLQLFAAYIKDAGFRTTAFEQFRQRSIAGLRVAGATPAGIMALRSAEVLHGGDKRWSTPSLEEMQGASVQDLKTLAGPVLADAPIEVIVTGDTTVEDASRAVAATFGALPPRSNRFPSLNRDVPLPATGPAPVLLPTSVPSAQSLANIVWITPALWTDLHSDAAMRLLAAILREKLLDDVRGKGLSYSVSVAPVSSAGFDFGYLVASATMPSGQAQTFYDTADTIVADLKAGKISADEFARSLNPTVQGQRRSEDTNDYWQALLAAGWDLDVRLERGRRFAQVLQGITAEDVAAAARKYLTPERMVRISAGS